MTQEEIEIPFGAKDSELCGWEYTIPSCYEAEIKDGKVIVRKKEEPLTEFEKAIKDMGHSVMFMTTECIKQKAEELLDIAFAEFKEREALHMIGEAKEEGRLEVLRYLPKWKNTIFAYKNPEVPKIETKCGPSYQLHYKGLWIDVDELFKKLPKE